MWAVENPRPDQPTRRWLAGMALVPSSGGPRCQISSWNTPNPTEALLFEDKGNAQAAARLTGGSAVALGNEDEAIVKELLADLDKLTDEDFEDPSDKKGGES